MRDVSYAHRRSTWMRLLAALSIATPLLAQQQPPPLKWPKGQVVERKLKAVAPDRYLPRLLELGKADDEVTAVAALSLAVSAWPTAKEADEAFDLLLKRFAASPRLADFVREYQRQAHAGMQKRAERLAAQG